MTTTPKSRIIPWVDGAPFWCGRPENRYHLHVCHQCNYTEQWGEIDPDPRFEGYELHCKLVRYRDHTGTSMASPCIFLTASDCPLHQTRLMGD